MTGMTFKRAYWVTFLLLAMSLMLGASSAPLSGPLEQVRTFTRKIEFDYVTWTLNSLGIKLGEIALGTANYLPSEDQSKTVLETLKSNPGDQPDGNRVKRNLFRSKYQQSGYCLSGSAQSVRCVKKSPK